MNTAEAIEHCAEAFADSLGADFSALGEEEKADFLAGASVVIAAHLGWLVQNGFNVLPPGAIPSPRSKGEATAMFNAGKAFLNDKNALLMSGPPRGAGGQLIHFVCVRTGDKYPVEHVEILFDMIARHHHAEAAFYCLTDGEVPQGVERIQATLPNWWAKVELFSDRMPWKDGDLIAYFDLDVCITGRLEDLKPGIIKDFLWPCYNSSVMVWRHGEHREIWTRFTPEVMSLPGSLVPAGLLASGMINGGDQEWISQISEWETFPADWFVSYRDAKAWPPAGCKAVIFHGADKPANVSEGWVPNVWKRNGWTAMPKMDGANVGIDKLLENIRANVKRDIPWFTGFGARDKEAVICCGGPSLKRSLQSIKDRKRRGATIITVNNTLKFLLSKGIKPDAHVMLDARPENGEFLDGAPQGVRYFLASQCEPSLFDALAGRDVSLWHNNAAPLEKQLDEILAPFWEGEDAKPCVKVPGGGTVGLRALNLAWLSGYRKIHIYGMDGSYEDGAHHAYPQALNDDDTTITVMSGGKEFRAAVWMVRQSEEFRWNYEHLRKEGVQVFVHGSGLIPTIWKSMQQMEIAA